MAISFELAAELREDAGKGASRRLRREGRVPGILYGGHKEPRAITLSQQQLQRSIENEAFFSHILTIRVGDVTQECILKDMQRHPFKKEVVHVDLQRIVAGEAIRMHVPLHFINEATCVGVKTKGGVISHTITDVEIQCLPKALPEYIEVDMGGIDLDDVIHLSDLKLPEGVELVALAHTGEEIHDQTVAACHTPRTMVIEEEAAETEAAEVPAIAQADDEDKSGD